PEPYPNSRDHSHSLLCFIPSPSHLREASPSVRRERCCWSSNPCGLFRMTSESWDIASRFAPELMLFVGNVEFSVDNAKLAGFIQDTGCWIDIWDLMDYSFLLGLVTL
ncbi:hypothetical protein Droror1_Dr00025149, partial [Drosera rotundifolia]